MELFCNGFDRINATSIEAYHQRSLMCRYLQFIRDYWGCSKCRLSPVPPASVDRITRHFELVVNSSISAWRFFTGQLHEPDLHLGQVAPDQVGHGGPLAENHHLAAILHHHLVDDPFELLELGGNMGPAVDQESGIAKCSAANRHSGDSSWGSRN